MRRIANSRTAVLAATIAAVTAVGIGVAAADSASKTPTNAVSVGHGVNEFGLTKSFYDGHTVTFRYSKGFVCDKTVKSAATTGCEAGANFNHLPTGAKGVDPLYITVPIGSGAPVPAMSMECPNMLVCVDHPGTIDLSRLESTIHTIPPYNGLSKAALTAALSNFATPGHDHFITTKNGGKAEWWDVKVVAVPTIAAYNAMEKHGTVSFLKKEIKAGKAVGPVDTNLFLWFSVN
jgi:hypothetical protein